MNIVYGERLFHAVLIAFRDLNCQLNLVPQVAVVRPVYFI